MKPKFLTLVIFILALGLQSKVNSQTQLCSGDINNDGRFDVVDLIRAINIILSVPPEPTDEERTAADVNSDGQIDVSDLIAIINFILDGSSCQSTGSYAITIDGFFDDWTDVPVAYSDVQGDGNEEDLAELKITNADTFLFLNLRFNNPEFQLRRGNTINLYIDTDKNAETGFAIHGIGAELEWCFGCGNGTFHNAQGPTSLGPHDLTLRMAPTFFSQTFEIAVSLSSVPLTLNGVQTPDTLSLVLVSSDEADLLPDDPGGVEYVIDPTPVDPPTAIPLARFQEDHLRLVSYNTEFSGLLNSQRQPVFERIIKALDPDIIALQEQRGGQQLESLLRNWLQTSNLWFASVGQSNTVVSKYPILQTAELITSRRTGAILLDTEAELGTQLLVLNTHLIPFNAAASQEDADELIMVLREWRSGNGPFELPPNTPIVHVGDFNLSGPSQLLTTLRDGDISDEARFGEDAPPDWMIRR